ncbi:lysine-specific demethylase 6A-like isoform X3 [Dendronephthya gigantea]|uniref:lysine-specific demethylase 6A-like isoform X3 n=1 Tax=Dendronephthya gigantea TaxID=151771 RepID=UPI00106A6951|nr:lysine-specific demethylase 6A-like isoform X3 [Dendronephthya gigantea]
MVDVLTEQESELLEAYDSRLFGFLRLTETICENLDITHKSLLSKAIRHYDSTLIKEGTQANPNIYCKLGHFHLLLEDYVKALSAYQKFFSIQGDYWKDAPFLYGLGIVYFHYGAYMWTIKAFQQVLYVDPGFSRSNEIHLKLGMMFKMQGNYDASMKHFHQALLDSHPCSLSKFEIQFHIGHLYEMQNKCQNARETYEAVAQSENVTNDVKSNVYKQLGWMFYTKEQLGDKQTRLQVAVQYLQKAIESDNTSGASWYLLGRCHAVQGKVHDAFTAYRHAIDKSDASADTWCSIGVLYQQQNQPMDALQAYICAVQLDPYHAASWTDLGILYEACGQPLDAVKCYNAAKRCGASSPALDARIKLIQAQADLSPNMNPQTKSLPLIEEAWKMPIPAELTSRTKSAKSQPQLAPPVQHSSAPSTSQQAQQLTLQAQQQQGTQQQQQQQQQQQHPTVSQQQQAHPAVQHQLALSQPNQQPQPNQHPQIQQTVYTSNHQQQQSHQHPSFNMGGVPQSTSPFLHPASTVQFQNGSSRLPSTSNQTPPVTSRCRNEQYTMPPISMHYQSHANTTDLQHPMQNFSHPVHTLPVSSTQSRNFTSAPQQTPLPLNTSMQSNFTTSQASSAPPIVQSSSTVTTASNIPPSLVNFQVDPDTGLPLSIINLQNGGMLKSTPTPPVPQPVSESIATPSGMLLTSRDPVLSSGPLMSEPAISNTPTQPLSVNVLTSSTASVSSPPLISPSLMSPGLLSPSRHYSLLSPSELKKTSQQGTGLSALGSVKVSLLLEPGALPQPPALPQTPCPREKLSPPTPSIRVETKSEAYSTELQNLCLSPSQPITVIRGLDKALGIDLSLFSTKALLDAHADHEVEVRTQKQQLSDENIDDEGRKVWLCESSRSYSTIAKYAQYQATTFQESFEQEDQERSLSDSDSSSSGHKRKKRGTRKIIKFGTNCDLSDEKKWKAQFLELNKLPPFLRVFSPGNMLSHVDHVILGMNSVQLYMKIPGCRTPGHQENLNFSSVNINIGPGDCEWFGVPYEYWGAVHNFCERNNVDFLMGSWWPILEDLFEERVPVYRFIQKPGDLVWVNAGTVHWVQAVGWCNNVAWNVGPLTEFQYNMAVERYEWNKLQGNRSIVPMILLTWNLARNIKISEKKLYEHMRQVLARVLKYCQVTLDCLKEAGVTVTLQRRGEHEAAHYCSVCETEVFNILFVTNNKKHQVHCQDCARKTSDVLQGFVVLQQFPMEELYKTYNDFRLFQHSSASVIQP